jgi:hypothetical protein
MFQYVWFVSMRLMSWSLTVILQSPIVTEDMPSALTTSESEFSLHFASTGFVWFSEQTDVTSMNSIQQPIFVTETLVFLQQKLNCRVLVSKSWRLLGSHLPIIYAANVVFICKKIINISRLPSAVLVRQLLRQHCRAVGLNTQSRG